MNEPTPRIEVADLVVRYGEVHRGGRVSASTSRRGELVTLLGPSGCGKTTTLRAIAGLETAERRQHPLNGDTGLFRGGAAQRAGRKARRVDGVPVLCDLAAHDGVRQRRLRAARAQAAAGRGRARTCERVLDLVQMRGFADRPASKLSGGQQQRVAVARAIAFSPSVLLFDEPLSNLDAKLRAEMRVELRELQRRLGHHVALCDARPGGGAGDLRPGDRDEWRPDRADRHAGGHLQPAAQPVRRRLRRHRPI